MTANGRAVLPLLVLTFLLTANEARAGKGRPLAFQELAACIQTYWDERLSSGTIEAEAAQAAIRSELLPNLTAEATGEKSLQSPSSSILIGSVALNQRLIDFSRWLLLSARREATEASELERQDQLLALELSASEAFHQQLTLREQIRFLADRSSRLKKVIGLLGELSRYRVIDRSDALAAEAERLEIEMQVSRARADALALMNQLRASIGLEPGKDLELVDSPETPLPDTRKVDWGQVAELTPSVRALRKRAEAADREGRAAGRELIPTLSASAALTQEIGRSPALATSANRTSVEVQGTLSLSLFDGGSRRARARRGDALADLLNQRAEAKRVDALSKIQSLLQQIDSQSSQVDFSDRRVALSRKAHEASWTLFQAGKKTYLAFKDMDNSLTAALFRQSEAKIRLDELRFQLWLWLKFSGLSEGQAVGCPVLPEPRR